MAKKELIFSLTKKDFRFDYYKGTGSGGQKKNKTENCCRCTHQASKATGKAEEGRSKEANKKKAFKRMAESKEFQVWCKIEAMRRLGELKEVERKVDYEIKNKTKTEFRENNKWVEVS